MDRIAILTSTLILLAGCQGSTPPIDPFATYGPTRIPPPATGSARQNDPYYRGTLSATSSANAAAAGTPATAQGLPPYSRFTSEDEGNSRVQVADQRSTASPTSSTASSAASSASTTAGRRLDWRSPVAGNAGYVPPGTIPPQSPRPVFPTTAPAGAGYVGMPNEPMVQTGPPPDPTAHTRY